MKRTELREHIFKLVFGMEFNSQSAMPEQIRLYLEELSDAKETDLDYIRKKSENIASHILEIDETINAHAKGWKTGRMNKVDLSILRLAVYEIRWDEDVPVSVAIDEAVELAKKYSGDSGPSFVNGVLGHVAGGLDRQQKESES